MEWSASQADKTARFTCGSGLAVNFYQVLVELIDLRSFSNLWYWIMLAVMWSSASHWVIGVPFDLISRARRQGGALQTDLELVVRVQAGRLTNIADTAGTMLVAGLFFMLTVLGTLAIYYKIEFAQAVLLLMVPMTILSLMSLRTARLIEDSDGSGAALHRRLMRHRIMTQLLGMMSIFVTSMFGMYQNLHIGVLG
jgi:hypothetical protein